MAAVRTGMDPELSKKAGEPKASPQGQAPESQARSDEADRGCPRAGSREVEGTTVVTRYDCNEHQLISTAEGTTVVTRYDCNEYQLISTAEGTTVVTRYDCNEYQLISTAEGTTVVTRYDCNEYQLISTADGTTVVIRYDWTSFFATQVKKLSKLKMGKICTRN